MKKQNKIENGKKFNNEYSFYVYVVLGVLFVASLGILSNTNMFNSNQNIVGSAIERTSSFSKEIENPSIKELNTVPVNHNEMNTVPVYSIQESESYVVKPSNIFYQNGNIGLGISPVSSARLRVGGNTVVTGNLLVAPNVQFHSNNGNIITSGNVKALAFLINSDERLKENIVEFKDTSRKILELETIKYTLKDSNEQKFGVIAQDLEKIYPELVYEDEEGYKSVDYVGLIIPLIDVVKQQQDDIDYLKKVLGDLE
jgi:hypothetical protein